MEKSYIIVYQGSLDEVINDLLKNQIEKYIILNDTILVIYVPIDFDELKLTKIDTIAWWQNSAPMSSLIDITNNMSEGESTTSAAGTDYIYKNPYINITGKGILIAIIDSGIDYLHPDFINLDGTTRIVSIWDQENMKKNPPKGLLYGSEFTRDEINQAIKENDDTLTKDNIGTGTMAAGIASGNGRLNREYKGVAVDSELIIVKLREYKDRYKKGTTNYEKTDFLAAIKYVLDIAKKEKKELIINLTVGLMSKSIVNLTMLETFSDIGKPGIVVVSGAGNEGNTDIHYQGIITSLEEKNDITIQVGEQLNLDITIVAVGPDKIGASIISPGGEVSYQIMYSPDFYVYRGKFNLEDTAYEMKFTYPWLESGHQELIIRLLDVKPGIWNVRLAPEFIIRGEYDLYLPNKNLMSENTRFLDPDSVATLTMYATQESVITIGGYNGRTDSLWIGSSKGPIKNGGIKPDIIAPCVDIISTYKDKSYNTATGTGVSSSVVSGVLALMMEFIKEQTNEYEEALYTQQLKTYLMLGATKNEIYTFPNVSQGYGVLNLKDTIISISNNFE